ncbi:putative exostosin [Helianthus annuus]|nr:putative exostosin [Helianthus annuus]
MWLLMPLWLPGLNLGSCKTTSYVTVGLLTLIRIMPVPWNACMNLYLTLISTVSLTRTPPPKKPQKTLANALCCRIAQSLGEDFHLSPRQKAVIECLQRPHAQDFLTVIPIEGLGQRMSAMEYRSILKYRLMIPMFPNDETCPFCRKACLDKYGEHALHCRELSGFKYSHDFVRNALMDILRRAGISAKKEAPVNFLTDPSDGRSTLRPADVLVFGWDGGKHVCVDLTGVSP